MGITEIILDARNRGPAYTETITRLYREAIRISGSVAGSTRDAGLKELKREIADISAGTVSPGHFLQGLRNS
jgi:collagenase-like PrtC family protease